ncbi:FAD-dependent oxidoreductase [Nocardioides sp. TRM66260-LWL]|uniref:NAD(P)/FAD-dependent oxidoreductase n=1 Tax=Nocardioides sp. TRM66260-LWL TaxID=2874478 RepID=UPI001CC4AFC8|nr:FAD-dependent oxidoreductase [Nocardioides sp. TRM66260-LWL]MBZ5735324.1 FAD-dependent oxidoreductase [Nocardioides sp. TRM66260-LWL]
MSTLRRGVDRLVVVGASLTAARAVEEARSLGFEGDIVVIGEEAQAFYDRPPLSKDVLVGTVPPVPTPLLDAIDALDLDVRTSVRAIGLDPRNRVVRTSAGDVPFDAAILATGSTPRSLDVLDGVDGVLSLRSFEDAQALRERLEPGARLVVVGAGFIGGEVAASGRARGADVTLVELAALPLEQAVGSLVAERLAVLHRQYDVELRTRVTVVGTEGQGRLEKLRLSDGSVIDADVVVVGVGVDPATGWLRGSGIAVSDGVTCSPYLESTVPGVYAAGDVARWVNPWNGRSSRHEHWTAAGEQAVVAVRNALTEERQPCSIVPYFWSEWYGHKIQMLGEPADQVELTVAGGAADPFLAQYRFDGQLVGGFALDQTGLLMRRRRAISVRASWESVLR